MTSERAKLIGGIILLLSPFMLLGCVIGVLFAWQNMKVCLDEFKPGSFVVFDIDCVARAVSSSAPQYCHAKGVIYNIKGKETGIKSSLDLGYSFEIDWNKKVYPIFYRENGRFPILNLDEAKDINKRPYLYNILLALGIPFGVSGLAFFYFIRLKRKY